MMQIKRLVFGRIPGPKRIKGRPRENLAFLRLRVCVFGLNFALYRKMWQNDANKKELFLTAPPAKNDKMTGSDRVPKARERKKLAFLRVRECAFVLNFAQ